MKPFFTFEAIANRTLAWSNLIPHFLESETKITKLKEEKKDPNKPKGALSAYMFYMKLNRKRISEENEGIKFGEVGKKCGEEWAALDAMGKKKYEDMNAEDKKRHTKEMEAYNAKLSQIASPELTQMQESSECVDSETANAETEELAEKQERKKTTKNKKKLLSGGKEVEPKTTNSQNSTRKQKTTTTNKSKSTVEDDDI